MFGDAQLTLEKLSLYGKYHLSNMGQTSADGCLLFCCGLSVVNLHLQVLLNISNVDLKHPEVKVLCVSQSSDLQ